ncbi:MAG TPA: hypothetical protein VMT63_04645 [Bacteroidales bacterium]|nr:hypothetical protein [Bacteroidales bacterium]
MNTEQTTGNAPVNQQDAVKKAVTRTWITAIVLLVLVTLVFYLLYSKDHSKQVNLRETQKTTMTGQIAARDSVINEWINTFDEIEKNIAMIKEKEKLISVNSKDVEMSKTKKDQILDDIKAINTLLEQNKKKIASLTAQLAKSGGTIKALQAKVAALEASVKESETEISDLKSTLQGKNFEITQLNEKVVDMEETITKKDSVITTKTAELHTAFYVVGTFKDLKAKGLLTKEGGFIGLGKTEKMQSNFSDTAFVKVDISVTKSIPVNSKNARLISEHPAGSYKFIRDAENKITAIEITDQAGFWKISKYAVVELTK